MFAYFSTKKYSLILLISKLSKGMFTCHRLTKNFMCFGRSFTRQRHFGSLKMLTFENRLQMQVIKNVIVNYEMWIFKNGDVMRMRITCSFCKNIYCMCASVSLQSDVANYWLACIIQHISCFWGYVLNGVHFDNVIPKEMSLKSFQTFFFPKQSIRHPTLLIVYYFVSLWNTSQNM